MTVRPSGASTGACASTRSSQHRAGGHSSGGKPLVEHAPLQRNALPASVVATGDAHAPFTSHDHSIDTETACQDVLNVQPAEDRARTGIDRVAAQLVARKRRAVQQHDARAGTSEHERGDRACRPGSYDDHVGVNAQIHNPQPTEVRQD